MTIAAEPRSGREEALARCAAELARQGLAEGRRAPAFEPDPVWGQLRALGTELWLDTGDLEEARAIWTADFSNLTTNNTLVNKEVQKGLFDALVPQEIREGIQGNFCRCTGYQHIVNAIKHAANKG